MYQTDALSKTRQRLGGLRRELTSILNRLMATKPLWRGIVYENVRRCGKPSCRCATGEPHRTLVLADRSGPTQRNWIPETMGLFEEMTGEYRAFRRGRARMVKIIREMLTEIDRLEAAGLKEGKRAVVRSRQRRKGKEDA